MSEVYSDFAVVYDRLMDNIPYDDWCNYIKSLLKEYAVEGGLVAELGCGTGNITERLAGSGYDMIGIDNSIAMLDEAQKKQKANSSNSLYLCQDMREFELYGTVAGIISVCDSINYILDENELIDVFRLVNNYLDPKGYFIFDFNTRHYYLDVVANRTIAEDRDDISFIWDNYYDEEADINELALSLFIRQGDSDLFRKYEEMHLQRGYTLDNMISLIKASGLEYVASYNAFTRDKADDSCERIYVIAREKGK